MTDENVETHDKPDDECQVAVQPLEADDLNDGNAPAASAVGFDPSRPVARSAPPPETLSGLPAIPANADEALASGSSHTEAGMTGGTDDDGTEPDGIE